LSRSLYRGAKTRAAVNRKAKRGIARNTAFPPESPRFCERHVPLAGGVAAFELGAAGMRWASACSDSDRAFGTALKLMPNLAA
jgi:hypothetical protein